MAQEKQRIIVLDPKPGFTDDHDLLAPDGKLYHYVQDIGEGRIHDLLASGAVVVRDECGCAGGCQIEWLEPTDRRARDIPAVGNKRGQLGFIEEWAAPDGSSLIYYGGPHVYWD